MAIMLKSSQFKRRLFYTGAKLKSIEIFIFINVNNGMFFREFVVVGGRDL